MTSFRKVNGAAGLKTDYRGTMVKGGNSEVIAINFTS